MNIDLEGIGLRLHNYRKTKGLSQKSLAENTGIERTYISRVENGMPPSFDFMLKLTKSFDISVDWLLSGEGQMNFKDKANLLSIVDHDYLQLIETISKLSEDKKKKFIPIFLNLLDD
ncbi:MAG: helix-turn-helix transcriptional regulator [Leptospirales bacterium]